MKADGRPDPAASLPAIQSSDDERAEAARPGARVFALFLDEYHVAPEATARVKELARAFVSEQVGAGDLMIVLRPLDPLLALRLTRDRDAVLREVDEFEGRLGQYEPRNAFERDFVAGDPARVEATRAQITISALHALATHLGRIAGARKTALVVTEGFVPREIRRGGELLPTLDAVIRASNSANVSWYPVDPRALAADSAAADDGSSVASRQRETVRRLAEETDGRSIANSPDLAAGLRRIVDDASGYYVMTFRGAEDGRFHPLEVRVNRPGARVRARPGYWAVSAEEVARIRKASMPVAPPPPLPPPTHVSPLIRPWFGVARGDDGRSRVTMVWEPARRVTGERVRALAPARLKVTASTPDGRPLFEGVVVPAGASAVDGESTQAVFDVAPGRVRLQDVGRRCGLAGARHRRQRGRRRWIDGCGRHRHARGPARAHCARFANAGGCARRDAHGRPRVQSRRAIGDSAEGLRGRRAGRDLQLDEPPRSGHARAGRDEG